MQLYSPACCVRREPDLIEVLTRAKVLERCIKGVASMKSALSPLSGDPQSKFDPTTPMDGIEKKVLFQEGDGNDESVSDEVTDEKTKVESKVGKGDSPINMSDFVKDEDIEALASALNATECEGSGSKDTVEPPELRPRKVKVEAPSEKPSPAFRKVRVNFQKDVKEEDGGRAGKKQKVRGGQSGPRGRDESGNPVKASYKKRGGPTITIDESPPGKSRGALLLACISIFDSRALTPHSMCFLVFVCPIGISLA